MNKVKTSIQKYIFFHIIQYTIPLTSSLHICNDFYDFALSWLQTHACNLNLAPNMSPLKS